MKKQILIALTLATMSTMATETELAGSAVSVIPITTSSKVTAVAVPFLEMDGSGNVNVAHLVKTANLAENDELYVYQNGNYECWKLVGNAWSKQTKIYTVNSLGQLVEGTGSDAGDVTCEVGTGFLLKTGSSPVTFYVYGKPSDKASMTLTAGTKTLVGNWTSTSKAPTISRATAGDAIVIPNEGLGMRYSYNGTTWYGIGSEHKPVAGLPTIAAGTGFWYVTAAGSTPTISW